MPGTYSAVRKFSERFWQKEWPGALRPRIFYDPRSLELEGATGVLHAKALVINEEAVFVTSANLTEAASTATSRWASLFVTAHWR